MSGVSKKGIFGFSQGGSKQNAESFTEWFDPGIFLVKGQEPLEEESEDRPRFIVPKLILILIVGVFAFRLNNLQITQGSENRYLAEGNRIRRQITVAPRGAILDKKGISLVANEPGYSLELVPSDLPQSKADRMAIYELVSQQTGLATDAVVRQVEKSGLSSVEPLVLKENLTREEALVFKIKFAETTGVRVSFVPSRKYDITSGLAHIVGYTATMSEQDIKKHPDYHRSSPIGRSGVESSYDSYLRGVTGRNENEVNATGKFQRLVQSVPPQEGKTLHLTLDKGLQQEMADALKEAMDKNGAKQAVGVAMDPRTGGILASVSLPSYDNNLFSKGIKPDDYNKLNNDPEKPLLNRAVNGLYPAGSTIKPMVAAAALQEGTINSKTTLDTSAGKIEIGQWVFPDWKVHGIADVKQAIAESNDIFFYALGGGYEKIPGLGVERLKKYYHMFGFGKSTGVDYANDSLGLVPDDAWKRKVKKEGWYIGDTYHIAIGQGDFLVTPLQLARATSSIANGGDLKTPHVVASVESANSGHREELTFPQEKIAISQPHLQTVREGMRRTVESGSARALNDLPFTSAGKTGTAQFGTEEKTHAWYMGYAPYENPEIVVSIIVEGGGEGNAISVPVARRVFDYYMKNK